MVDTITTSLTDATDEYGNTNPVFIDQNTGYFFSIQGGDLVVSKTTNGGTSWTGAYATIDSGAGTLANVGVWYDKWTPGRTGTVIHLAYVGPTNDTLYYNTYDTNGESTGSRVTVEDVGAYAPPDAPAAICVATNGDIHALCGSATGIHASISTNGGTSFSDNDTGTPIRTTLTDDTDFTLIVPLSSGDVMLVALDDSANIVYSLVYDQGTTSWDASFTTVSTGITSSNNWSIINDGSGGVYLALPKDQLATSSDFLVYYYSGTWASKTAPATSKQFKRGFSLAYDDINDELYACYIYATTTGLHDVYWNKSTNGATSWSGETQLTSTSDDYRYVRGPGYINADGNVYFAWYNDDTNTAEGDSVATVTAAAGGTEITPAQGNLTLSTTAPTVQASDNREITPNQGNLTLSTTAPTVEILQPPIEITPPQGDLILSTTAPTVEVSDNREIQPASGDLTLSSTLPTVEISENREITVPQGDLTFSTTAPLVEAAAGQEITPPQGNLVFSTTLPTIEVSENREIQPNQGDLTLSSTAPTVEISENREIEVPQGNLTFSTTAPTIEAAAGVEIGPPQGNLTLSTTAPIIEVSENREIQPNSGDLVLSTTAPTVEILSGAVDHEIIPPQGNLIFTSFAPQVETSQEGLIGGSLPKKKKRITDTALTRQREQIRKLIEKAKEEDLTVTEEERAKRIIKEITEIKEQQIDIPQIQTIIIEITILLGNLALLNEAVAKALHLKQLQEEDEEILLILASGL